MALVRAQVVLMPTSGIIADATVMTLYFRTAAGTVSPTDLDGMRDSINNFFNGTSTGQTSALCTYLSSNVDITTSRWKAYRMQDPTPRAPIRDELLTINSKGATAVASELALCLSFQATKTSGQIQARRRGRIYFGPLAVASTNRPSTQLVTDLSLSGKRLADRTDTDWMIFSPTTWGGSGDPSAAAYDVHDGWVDNAWDIQRRRGLAPSSRTAFVAV